MNAKLEPARSVWMRMGEIPAYLFKLRMIAMCNTLSLSLVFCLALGLTVAAYTAANADIDKSTVEAGRVHITGKLDTS